MSSHSSKSITTYAQLDVWKLAMDLVVEIYSITKAFPSDERFGLAIQLRRAAVSIPSNIAEGNARQSRAEYRHFVSISRGSLAEVETELAVAERLKYVGSDGLSQAREKSTRTGQMLTKLRKSLE